MGNRITEMSITELETEIQSLGYSITKKYDGVKGICTVTLTSKSGKTVITDANRSSSGLWTAYRRALVLVLQQLKGPGEQRTS
jgi:hypothetical protein